MYSNQFWERQPRGAKDTYVVTNNHKYGKAAANGLDLRGLITGQPIKVPRTLVEAYPLSEIDRRVVMSKSVCHLRFLIAVVIWRKHQKCLHRRYKFLVMYMRTGENQIRI